MPPKYVIHMSAKCSRQIANTGSWRSKLTAVATNPLFKAKSIAPNTTSRPSNVTRASGPSTIEWAPPSVKKTCAATQVAIVGAAMLKRIRLSVRWLCANRKVTTRPSKAAEIAPAAGPKRSAATMLKMSEIEKLIGIDGMVSIAQPLATVRPTRMSHPIPTGCRTRSTAEYKATAAPNTVMPST